VGVALGVLGLAGVVTLGAQQTEKPAEKQADKQAAPKVEQKVQTKVVTVEKPGQPMVVTVESDGGQEAKVRVRQAGEPAFASMLAGGPRLGIEIRDVKKEDVAALKLTGQAGVVVEAVTKDSAAEKAGVKAKDVIVALDGENVRSAQQLTRLVRETAPGRAVKLAVIRDGKRMDIEATPAEAVGELADILIDRQQLRGDIERQTQELRNQLNQYRLERRAPAAPAVPGAPARPGETPRWQAEGVPGAPGGVFQFYGGDNGPWTVLDGMARGRLGVTVQELTPELATYFGVKDGVLVATVAADSPAAKAGLKAGDIITTVDGKTVTAASDLISGLAGKSGEVTIGLTRDRKPLTLKATIEAPKAPGRRIVMSGRPV
jgi:serine protease Do